MILKSNFLGRKLGVMSSPDGLRKLHKKKIPQVGGIIFFSSLLLLNLLNYQDINSILNEITKNNNLRIFFFTLSFCCLFLMGFVDDRQDLSANTKLLFLIFIGYILFNALPGYQLNYIKLSFYKNIDLNQYNILVFIFFFILLINAMNMFDGINLQSAFYFFLIWTYISCYLGADLILINVLIFLSIFSFFNYKNRLFLGDSGTYLLTFLSFVYLLKIYHTVSLNVTLDDFLVLFLLPVVDCFRVFFLRILQKQNPFLGDRSHFHHIVLSKFGYKISIFIIFIGSSMPIIIYKLVNINFFVILAIFLLYYVVSLNFKIINNKFKK
jgi:UDP-GlcNAc:undecaprenyl-phosphate GlcNAc-1-phosphate transferase